MEHGFHVNPADLSHHPKRQMFLRHNHGPRNMFWEDLLSK